MGDVYRAVQLSLGRRVALKVLAPKLADDDVFRRRFLRESRIAASIDHPSIIPIYETGEDGGLLFIAMRYVDGMDLEPCSAGGPPGAGPGPGHPGPGGQRAGRRPRPRPGPPRRQAGQHPPRRRPGRHDGHCYLCDFGLIKEVPSRRAA